MLEKTYLAKLCLLHLGTDPSSGLVLSEVEWIRMTNWGRTN